MKNKLLNKYPNSAFNNTKATEIFIADFTKRTGNQRGVEIAENQPSDPNDSNKKMPCFVIDKNILKIGDNISTVIDTINRLKTPTDQQKALNRDVFYSRTNILVL